MLASLPDLPAAPTLPPMVPAAGSGPAAGGEPGTAAGLAFAGLLDAAMPAETGLAPPPFASPTASAPVPGTVRVTLALPETEAGAGADGTILPESGEALPLSPEAGLAEAPVVIPAQLPAPPLPAPPAAGPSQPEPEAGADASDDDAPAMPGVPAAAALTIAPATLPTAALAKATPVSRPIVTKPAALRENPALPARQPATPGAPAETAERPTEPAGPTPGASTALMSLGAPTPEPGTPPQASAASFTSLAVTPAPLGAAPAPLAVQAEARTAAPQLESTIAQVGEIREALRSVRPELTLRHAEFGLVSLRIEGTSAAPQDWRALLASRDPGFVPAIQAALADRSVTASADSAATGSGAGQNGTSDQRYGSSHSGGQGSSQPYLAHSGGRDEGAAQHPRHRQPSPDGERAAGGAGEAEIPERRDRGLFA